ncbi:MAG: YchJ family protein [Bdellovibrionales bacterium]|jgi:SEC-C motif domain protein|nr:YchJ family protein [Bdellovibrionales bacterium]MBT3525798.1 YchJ family protein [Bdellovibrionales bacterium]MBT7668870.1 YchJ family protein [Bdellovibrionales bacterium]MBT7765840.1 YchJ family protein [Bdellovibrionales bacterium]
MKPCPCNSGQEYQNCCEPYHSQTALPDTAEKLMRSRYSAYVEARTDYLHQTIHPDHRNDYDPKATEEWSKNSEWLGLDIISTQKGGSSDSSGVVEFRANYKNKSGTYQSYEISRFEKLENQWFYTDSETPKAKTIRNSKPKVGRNQPCPCGSNKKYKKCCG